MTATHIMRLEKGRQNIGGFLSFGFIRLSDRLKGLARLNGSNYYVG